MDRSECEALMRKHLTPMLEFLSVGHWRVTSEVGRIDEDDTTATCRRNAPYDIATIRMDPEKFQDESFFLDTLFHEIANIVLAPFDVYRQLHCATLEPKSIPDKQEDFVWAYSVEKAVINLERLWRRHLKALYLKSRESDVNAEPPADPPSGPPDPPA